MSDGVYVRVKYREEFFFEQKFRVISGDTIVVRIDDFVDQQVAAEREKCAKVCDEFCPLSVGSLQQYEIAVLEDVAAAIRARGKS